MNKALRLVALLLLLIHVSLLGGCDLKEAFCEFLGESCGDPRPSEDPDFKLDTSEDLPQAVRAAFASGPPTTVVAGRAWPVISVELLTIFGTKTGNPASVNVELVHDGSSELQGTLQKATSSGSVDFSGLIYTKVATLSVGIIATGSEDAPEIESPSPLSVKIVPAASADLEFNATTPTSVVAGNTWPDVFVHLVDEFGNKTKESGITILMSVVTGSDVIVGDASVQTVNGTATFSGLSYDTSEELTIRVTRSGVPAQSDDWTITINAAPVAAMAFDIPPGIRTQVDSPMSFFSVELLDSLGNRATNASPRLVTLTHNGSGSFWAMRGPVNRMTVGGVAVFDDVAYDTIETMDVTATVAGVGSATRTGLSVEAGPDTGTPTLIFDVDEAAMMDGLYIPNSIHNDYAVSHDARYVVTDTLDSFPKLPIALLYSSELGVAASTGLPSYGPVDVSSDGRFILHRAYSSGSSTTYLHDLQMETNIFVANVIDAQMVPSGRYISHESPIQSGLLEVTDVVTGRTIPINLAADGGMPDRYDVSADAAETSDDGRHVLFQSEATNLTSPPLVSGRHLYVRDRDVSGDGIFDEIGDARTVQVNIATDGTPANSGYSNGYGLSASGRYVVFSSLAVNLVPGDTDAFYDVYLHDRDASGDGVFDEPDDRITILASINTAGQKGDADSIRPSISADGRFVSFVTEAANLDQRVYGLERLVVHDRDVSVDGTFDEMGDIATTLASVFDGSDGRPIRVHQRGIFSGDSRFLNAVDVVMPNPFYEPRVLVQINEGGNVSFLTEQVAGMDGDCDFTTDELFLQVVVTKLGTDLSGMLFVSEDINDLLPAPMGLPFQGDLGLIVLPHGLPQPIVEESNIPTAMWGVDPSLQVGPAGSTLKGFRIDTGGISYLRVTYPHIYAVFPAGYEQVINVDITPPQESGGAFELTWTRRCLAP